jgi:hypothetical protein
MERLKTAGAIGFGIVVLAGMVLFFVLILKGMAWATAAIYPTLYLAFQITLGITLVVLIPLAAFRRTRAFSATAILIASYVFGATLWCYGFLITLATWGWLAVILGLFILGVGVVPIAVLASMLEGNWDVVAQFVALIAATFGARYFALWLESKLVEVTYIDISSRKS